MYLEGFFVFSSDFFAFWDFLINFKSIVSFQKNILSDCEYLVVYYTHARARARYEHYNITNKRK